MKGSKEGRNIERNKETLTGRNVERKKGRNTEKKNKRNDGTLKGRKAH